MGVNCCVTLNPKADWKTVRDVACKLLGAPMHKEPIGRDGSYAAWLTEPSGAKRYEPCTDQPAYIYLLLHGDEKNPVMQAIAESDGTPYQFWYGIENRFLYPRATAAKIALCVGLVKFFGGSITYNDAEGKKRTFKPPRYIGAEDGKPWRQYQDAQLALKPLTQKDIDRCRKYAAY